MTLLLNQLMSYHLIWFLCQLLLSYLSISHKIRFECVSKQSKELVFNKQQKLIVIEKTIYLLIDCIIIWDSYQSFGQQIQKH